MFEVFCYGTLKRGGRFEHLLVKAGGVYERDAMTVAAYWLSTSDRASFPCLTGPPAGKRGVAILGEVWECDGDCLRELDRIEGVSRGLFARGQVELSDGGLAIAYFYAADGGQPMEVNCGDSWPPALAPEKKKA